MKRIVTGRRLAVLIAAVAVAAFGAGLIAADSPKPAIAQGPLAGQLQSYADVAEIAMPAVVNIAADKVVEQSFQHPFMQDPFWRRFFEMPDDETHRGRERVSRSLGSGVVISADGYIITNNHVVQDAEEIRVVFEEDREYEAEIVGSDPRTDIALIKIEGKDFPAIRMGDSDALRIGDQVMAIGNPFGVGQTATMGIVSALGRSIGMIDYEDMIQTDAAINPGNSGGALVNMYGELVGMNTAIVSRSGGSQGVGLAIPTSMIHRITDALKSEGEVVRAYLGVLPQEITQAMADYYKMEKPRGVLIAQVTDDTPAKKAGLEDGDIILSVDGKEIRNPSMLRNVISLSDVGHKAKLKILREGKEKDFTVKLERLPDPEQLARGGGQDDDEDGTLEGVTVSEISERMRRSMDLPEEIEGIFVANVEQTSKAARAGLAQGDIIVAIGDRNVTNFSEFQDALGRDKDRPIWMKVYKPQQRRHLFLAVER